MSLLDRLKNLVSPPASEPWTGDLRDLLQEVLDPELGIDIVSMGLIRDVRVEGKIANVRMTLSTEGCPVGPAIVDEVASVLRRAGYDPVVTLEFDPPWTPEKMSDAARLQLGFW